MTWPLRKLREAALPALKSAAGLGLAAITSSQNFSIALVSLNCSIPFSFTIAAAPFPLENISEKTSLPCLPLIFPLSIKLTSSSSASASAKRALQIVQDPIRDVLRFLRSFGGRFEITRKIDIVRQHAGVIRRDLILLDKPRAFCFRQFRNACARIRQQRFALYRDQIRIGKITIVMRRFFCAH